ncbi:MAG: cell division protein FtsQ/DivIB [Clostridia bacterium]
MDEKKRRRRKRRRVNPGCLLSFVMLVLAAVVLFLTPLFEVDRIVVKGNSRISSEVLIDASEITEGKNIFMANTSLAEKNIRNVQYVDSVKVKRILPGKIEIRVTEGVVAGYINCEDSFVGISLQGKTLCFIDKASYEGNVPIIYGLSVKEDVLGSEIVVNEKKNYKVAMTLLNEFSENDMLMHITHLDVTNANNIAFRYGENLKVELGDMSDVDYKFSHLVEIINYLGENPSGLINMKNTDNISYRQSIE